MNNTDSNTKLQTRGVSSGVAVIAGAVLGAAAAIALSDKKTRDKMQKSVSDVGHQMNKWMQQSDELLEASGEKIGETKELIVDKAEDIKKATLHKSQEM